MTKRVIESKLSLPVGHSGNCRALRGKCEEPLHVRAAGLTELII
jgi:hypothetical protein